MPVLEPVEIERLRYHAGQTLRSRDFNDQLSYDAQLRWWHNRALHNTYGVAQGLQVQAVGAELVISPGIAYDCFGREIILLREQRVPVPDQVDLTLLLRYRATAAFPRKEDMAGACLPERNGIPEEPDFCWMQTSAVGPHDGVPLARTVKEGIQQRSYQSHAMPYARAILPIRKGLHVHVTSSAARPLARPHIASGSTVPGSTSWVYWNPSSSAVRVQPGLQVQVDTSSAGFSAVPCYFAWLDVSRIEKGSSALWVLVRQQHIADTSDRGFTFRLLFPVQAGVPPEYAQKYVSVCWIGVQPAAAFTLL